MSSRQTSPRRLQAAPAVRPAASRRALEAAARILRKGGLVAFPTETVYGVGVRQGDAAARRRLVRLKRRPREKPFQLLVRSRTHAARLADGFERAARHLADAFWPGPLTLVVRDGRGRWIGLRVPDNRTARSLARRVGGALAATSANLSGGRPARTAAQAAAALGGAVDLILDGGPVRGGKPSTVVRVDGTQWEMLREGALTRTAVAQVLRAGPGGKRRRR